MGLKLHGIPASPNVVRVVTVLNEKALDYEFVTVDLRSGEHKKPPFLAINPFGEVPVLEDGDIKLFESRAITKYLALQYKESGADLLSGKSPAQLAAFGVWLEVETQQFGPAAFKLAFEVIFKPFLGLATDPAVVEAEAGKLAKVLDVYEARLSENAYLAGDEFTLVDANNMSLFFFLLKTPKAALVTSRPHLKAWWDRVSARPAWQKTVASIPM